MLLVLPHLLGRRGAHVRQLRGVLFPEMRQLRRVGRRRLTRLRRPRRSELRQLVHCFGPHLPLLLQKLPGPLQLVPGLLIALLHLPQAPPQEVLDAGVIARVEAQAEMRQLLEGIGLHHAKHAHAALLVQRSHQTREEARRHSSALGLHKLEKLDELLREVGEIHQQALVALQDGKVFFSDLKRLQEKLRARAAAFVRDLHVQQTLLLTRRGGPRAAQNANNQLRHALLATLRQFQLDGEHAIVERLLAVQLRHGSANGEERERRRS
eukprot:scaffold3504_cov240-Pinguiococcus_pyrenoidosus.AAC.46